MKGSNKISPKDYGFVPIDPDPDFNAEHNREIIRWTIAENEKNWRKKQRAFEERVKERSEAISTYLEALKMGNTSSSLRGFFGKEELMKLKGQEIISELKEKVRLNPNGSVMKSIKQFHAQTKSKRQ